jgi:hypothetical protein
MRRYLVGVHELFEAIREESQIDQFRLDRFTEDGGRIIGHKNTTSSARKEGEFSTATTAMMVIMNIKVKKIEENETEMVVNFAFESGHGTVTREEEEILLECYNAILRELDGKFVRAGVSPAGG